jgi:hypothetical protein
VAIGIVEQLPGIGEVVLHHHLAVPFGGGGTGPLMNQGLHRGVEGLSLPDQGSEFVFVR